MKSILIKQALVFIVVLAAIMAGYYYYQPFATLVDDVIAYAAETEKQDIATTVDASTERTTAQASTQPVPTAGGEPVMPAPTGVSQPPMEAYPASDEPAAPDTQVSGASPLPAPPVTPQHQAMPEAPVMPQPQAMPEAPAMPQPQAMPAPPAMSKFPVTDDGFRPLSPAPMPTPMQVPAEEKPTTMPLAAPPAPELKQAPKPEPVQRPMWTDPGINMPPPSAETSPDTGMPPAPAAPPRPPASNPDQAVQAQKALEGLTRARAAWRLGNAELAISHYRQLMTQYPDHPDFASELGNIYYSRGDFSQAVDVYTETFQRLMRMHDYDKAWQILSVIRRKDYERARQLERAFTE